MRASAETAELVGRRLIAVALGGFLVLSVEALDCRHRAERLQVGVFAVWVRGPCVTFRKITNGFRTEWAARLYADIRSVIETARRRAIGALQAIRLTLADTPLPAPAS